MMRLVKLAAGVLAATCAAGVAHAVPVTRQAEIVNHSFEEFYNGSSGPSNGSTKALYGWNVGAGSTAAIWNPTAAHFAEPPNQTYDGTYVARSGGAGAGQTLSEILVAGRTYELIVSVGDSLAAAEPNWAFELRAGSNLLARLTRDTDEGTLPNGAFADRSIKFTALSTTLGLGEALGIRFYTTSGFAYFDNFRLFVTEDRPDDPIETPEPGMLALMGLGTLAVAGIRRRRQAA